MRFIMALSLWMANDWSSPEFFGCLEIFDLRDVSVGFFGNDENEAQGVDIGGQSLSLAMEKRTAIKANLTNESWNTLKCISSSV